MVKLSWTGVVKTFAASGFSAPATTGVAFCIELGRGGKSDIVHSPCLTQIEFFVTASGISFCPVRFDGLPYRRAHVGGDLCGEIWIARNPWNISIASLC